MEKMCSRCKKVLALSEFNWKIKDTTRAAHCRSCSREYVRDHYSRNKQYYIEKAHIRNLKVKEEINAYIWSYLSSHPCIDCGETDPIVLEFDHRERAFKIDEVSRMSKDRGVIKTVINEVSKCEVRCANCHRRKTAKETRTWKLNYAPVA